MKKLKILFLCTGNSCRSQMAEGWARHLKSDVIEACSAGIEKHGMNPLAVKAMAEVGVDISGHYSKTVADLPVQEFDYVITLCGHANETCPYFSGTAKKMHRAFDDPPRMSEECAGEEEKMAFYREVRDQIKEFVKGLPKNIS